MSQRPLITVFGACGESGGGCAAALLRHPARPLRLRAVTRRPGSLLARALAEQGAEICAADLDDPAAVERALHGAHGLYCDAAALVGDHLRRAEHLAAAAQRCAVRHVVWSATLDGSAAELLLQRAGLPLSRIAAAVPWHLLAPLGLQPQRCCGVWRLRWPFGDGLLPGIAAADVGAIAAHLLLQGDAERGRRIGVAAQRLHAAALAAAWQRRLGEPVLPVAVDTVASARPRDAAAAARSALLHRLQFDNAAFNAGREVVSARASCPALQTFEQFLGG